tara:strand:+ start:3111 stop:3527 length:417 start_codon:yes stop_codon:yes gene_type:complete
MMNLIIPLIMQLGFATISLDDGHTIRSQFVQSGTITPESGFVVTVGDMADIQSSLHGNSCLIRVSEIKARFKKEVGEINDRCEARLGVLQKALDESKQLNEHLRLKLEDEKTHSKNLIIVSSAVVGVLTASTLYFSLR